MYKRSSGRIQLRQADGRFFTPNLSDLGYDVANGYQVCSNCGYGNNKRWRPVLMSGTCPSCECQEKSPKQAKLSELAINLKKQIDEIKAMPFPMITELRKLASLNNDYQNELDRLIEDSFIHA